MYTIGINHPLYKNDNLIINSSISFDFNNSVTQAHSPNAILDNYDLRVLNTGINIIKEDHSGRWVFNNTVGTGIPLLGATTTSNDGLGSGKFVKLNDGVTRIQFLPFKSLGIFKLNGQYSPNSLISSEQFQIGGASSVRGFDEGLVIGDIGYNLSLETITPVPFLPKKITIPYFPHRSFDLPLKDRIKYALFYDQGFAEAIHQGRSEHYTNFLQGVGFGLRIYLTKYLTASIDLGIPLGRDRSTNQQGAKLHFTVSSNLL